MNFASLAPEKGVDTPKIVRGEPLFGIDTRLPGLLHAAIVKCPAIGGTIASYDDAAVKSARGVVAVVPMSSGQCPAGKQDTVAIVGTSWWAVQKLREKLVITWDIAAQQGFSTELYGKQAAEALGKAPDATLFRAGDADAALGCAAKVITADYSYPFLAHATLEPQNCTALWHENGTAELWAPSQNPGNGRRDVAAMMGIAPEAITIHMTRIGGGFGRRLMNDYMVMAAQAAKALPRTPGQAAVRPHRRHAQRLLPASGLAPLHRRSRRDRRAGGVQRPLRDLWRERQGDSRGGNARLGISRLGRARYPSGAVLPLNQPDNWLAARADLERHGVCLSELHGRSGGSGGDGPPRSDAAHFGRAARSADRTCDFGVQHRARARGDRTGGRALGLDGQALSGCGQGARFRVLFQPSGYFAEVVDVTVSDGAVKVDKVWIAGDIGSQIINPLNAEHQAQGAAIDGLAQALVWQPVVQEAGAVQTVTFSDFPLLRMDAKPAEIAISWVKNDYPPTGLGEPALPPVIPAVANAIRAATGKRLRSLPCSWPEGRLRDR